MKIPNFLSKVHLPQKFTRFVARTGLKIKNAAPEICIGMGVVAGGTAIVIAVVETWRHKEKIQEDIDEIKTNRALVKEECDDKDVVKERRVNLNKTYVVLVKDVGIAYWKPATLAVSSALLIFGGGKLLRNRLNAMTVAYATLFDASKKYREAENNEGNELEGDAEELQGNENTSKKKKYVLSPYARWFDEGAFDSSTGQWLWRNYAWKDNPTLNELTIKSAQISANNLLKANGYLFLNDVYKLLCLPPSVDGQIVGWDLCGNGDGFVDFGVFDGPHQLPVNKQFLDGRIPNALLDFNVDGPILGALEKTWGSEQTEKLIAHKW